MKSPRSISIVAFVLCALAGLPLWIHAQNTKGQLVIKNKTDRVIEHLYLAPLDTESWGDDLLKTTIEQGGSQTIRDIPCGEYKAKIDGDGDNQAILLVTVCKGAGIVVVNNKEMHIKPPM